MTQISIASQVDQAIVSALQGHAPDLDISYCWWMERSPAGDIYQRHTGFHFETTFRHPKLPDARMASMPSIRAQWPPALDMIELTVREAVLAIRKSWAIRLHVTGHLPESGWERDLVGSMNLSEHEAETGDQ